MTDIPLALGGLKTAIDIAKSLIGVRDQTIIQTRVIELNRIILQVQEDATIARAERDELKQTIRALQAEIEATNSWDAEATHYALKQVGKGVVLYGLKTNRGEPDHYLCPNCFSDRKKSFVQKTQASRHGELFIHKCFTCSSEFEFEARPWAGGGATSYSSSYDPYAELE
jgi:formate dehydrogenase maturation protein FdhE